MIKEHHLTVMKTARYMTIGEHSDDVRQVGFVCHGYGYSVRSFLEGFVGLANKSRLIVAPEGLSRFYLGDDFDAHGKNAKIGASWMTSEDRENEIGDYINYLDVLYARVFKSIDRANVGVFALGFSQGAAAASRWIAQGTIAVDHLILWGGRIPPDLDLHMKKTMFKRLRLTLVAGTEDPFVEPDKLTAAVARLEKHGIPCEVVRFDGGHEIDGDVLKRVVGEGA